MTQAYKVQGVPAMAVDGKYLVTGEEIRGLADLVVLTDQVIEKACGDRNKK